MADLRLRYQTIEFPGMDIHVRTLRDNQQYADVGGTAAGLGITSATWSLFGVLWESSYVLAHRMLNYETAGKRILEVGCGIGLASLVLNQRGADITATDYHPEVAGFMAENVRLNNGRPIPFVRTSWADSNDNLGQFDTIIGSDLLYEPDHIQLLSAFIQRHASPQCEIVLVDPDRRQQRSFIKTMLELGYECNREKPDTAGYLPNSYKGHILHFNHQVSAKETLASPQAL